MPELDTPALTDDATTDAVQEVARALLAAYGRVPVHPLGPAVNLVAAVELAGRLLIGAATVTPRQIGQLRAIVDDVHRSVHRRFDAIEEARNARTH